MKKLNKDEPTRAPFNVDGYGGVTQYLVLASESVEEADPNTDKNYGSVYYISAMVDGKRATAWTWSYYDRKINRTRRLKIGRNTPVDAIPDSIAKQIAQDGKLIVLWNGLHKFAA